MQRLNPLAKRTITKDLSTLLLVSISVFFVFACLIEIAFLRKADQHFLKKQAQTIIENASGVIAQPLWALDTQVIASIIDQYNNFEQVNKIMVLDENNNAIASFVRKQSNSGFFLRKDVIFKKANVGSIQIHFSKTIPEKQENYALIALLTLIGLLSICLITTAFVLKKFLSKPLNDVISKMESISSGQKARILSLPPQSELSNIAHQTNIMADAISNREENLRNQKLRLIKINDAITSLTKASSISELIEASVEILLGVSGAKSCIFYPKPEVQLDYSVDKLLPFSATAGDTHEGLTEPTIELKLELGIQSKTIGTYKLSGSRGNEEVIRRDLTTIISLIEESMTKLQNIKANMMNLAEMKIAQTVQEGMLLSDQSATPELDIAFLYQPMNRIGGDWFRVWSSPDATDYYFMMGDVTGHGVGSGLVTTAVNGTLQTLEYLVNENSLKTGLSPENIMDVLNHLIGSISGSSSLHMTCVVAKLSLKKNELRLCNAGHTFPLILENTNKEVHITPLTKHLQPMLGEEFSKDFKYQSAQYTIKNEAYLLLFTDGLLEAQNEQRQAFSRRFIRILKQMHDVADSEGFKQAINEKLTEHCQNSGLNDDICLVVVKKEPKQVQQDNI
ncbi:MAG: SpoIIE family protein phosphatase [Oligoflexales bacterium]|nr:SpoIIE family protein phosphatase [Oligoflexales bacterium]